MKSIWHRFPSNNSLINPKEYEVYFGGNSAGKNILIFTENVNATYFISFDIPLRRMHARGEVNVAVVSQNFVGNFGPSSWEYWSDTFKPEIVVMTRYGQPYGKSILDFFKSRRIPVVYHIDDDLLELPSSLGKEISERQGATDVVDSRKYLLNNADLVYVSTKYLANLIQSRFPNQKIYHGIYAPYLGEEIESTLSKNEPVQVIGYMGSKGHQNDLELVVPALDRLLDERLNLKFELFGTIRIPSQLERFGNRVISRPVQKSYLEFLSLLGNLDWSVGLAPLVDEDFNRCKAPTKFVEYTTCSIPTIASDIAVYSDVIPEGGGALVSNDWYYAISRFLDNPASREKAVLLARNYCKRAFAISELEHQLEKVFSQECLSTA